MIHLWQIIIWLLGIHGPFFAIFYSTSYHSAVISNHKSWYISFDRFIIWFCFSGFEKIFLFLFLFLLLSFFPSKLRSPNNAHINHFFCHPNFCIVSETLCCSPKSISHFNNWQVCGLLGYSRLMTKSHRFILGIPTKIDTVNLTEPKVGKSLTLCASWHLCSNRECH